MPPKCGTPQCSAVTSSLPVAHFQSWLATWRLSTDIQQVHVPKEMSGMWLHGVHESSELLWATGLWASKCIPFPGAASTAQAVQIANPAPWHHPTGNCKGNRGKPKASSHDVQCRWHTSLVPSCNKDSKETGQDHHQTPWSSPGLRNNGYANLPKELWSNDPRPSKKRIVGRDQSSSTCIGLVAPWRSRT